MPFEFTTFVTIASLILGGASFLLRPKPPRNNRNLLDRINVPQAATDEPVPVVFGVGHITSPNILYYNLRSYVGVSQTNRFLGIKTGEVSLGRQPVVHLQFCLANGPISEIRSIRIGATVLEANLINSNVRALDINTPITDNVVIDFISQDQGQYAGRGRIFFGESDQPGTLVPISEAFIPTELNFIGHRGVTTLFLTDFNLGLNIRTIPSFNFVVQSVFKRSTDWYPQRAEIPRDGDIPAGSMNPAHIIYHTLTNPLWGAGISSSAIDENSFMEAADILYDERFGLNFVLTEQVQAKEFIGTVLEHIDATLFVSNENLFVLRIYRLPSVSELDDSIILNESNSTLNAHNWASYDNIVNEIVLIYRPQGMNKDDSITIQNISAVYAQDVQLISERVEYIGIDNREIASRVAQRELLKRSAPLLQVEISSNRLAYNLNPGDIVRYTNSNLGIENLTMRVFDLDKGNTTSSEIRITCTQDIYTLPNVSFLAPPSVDFTPPSLVPVPITRNYISELPYVVLRDYDFTPDTFRSNFISVAAATPIPASIYFDVYTAESSSLVSFPTSRSGADLVDQNFTPYLEMRSALDLPRNTTPQVVEVTPFPYSLNNVAGNRFAYLNDEVIHILSVDAVNSTVRIQRGLFDTQPRAHVTGSFIYLVEDNLSLLPDPYSQNDDFYLRLTSATRRGTLPLASATSIFYQVTARQYRPLPVRRVLLQNAFFPIAVNQLNTQDTSIIWSTKSRLVDQLSFYASFFSNSGKSPPEAPAWIIVRIYGEANTLINTETITSTTASDYSISYTTSDEMADSSLTGRLNGTIRIQIEMQRQVGRTSVFVSNHQNFEHTYDRAGYGYNYGEYYGGFAA